MCIFSQPVISVSDTNIFARLLPNGRQCVVYQMNFETEENNAIILPVPVRTPAAEEASLSFVSLKKYPGFFRDLNKGFPLRARPAARLSRSPATALDSRQKLRVHEVGDFIASFVPTVDDFDRLDAQFRLPRESWNRLPLYADYGFAVFQLQLHRGKPHPMAFHFDSRLTQEDPQSLFFPTVHIHDGEVHSREHFDHTLYLQAPGFDRVCGEYRQEERLTPDTATGWVRSKHDARSFCRIDRCAGLVDGSALVHRRQMQGMLDNKDVLTAAQPAEARRLSLVPRSLMVPVAAGIGAFAGLRWIADRRNKVAQAENSGAQSADAEDSAEQI